MPTYSKEPKSVEDILAKQVIVNEVYVSRDNLNFQNSDFEACVDLLDSNRTEKEYDWMSDIRIPEFASHHLTQSAIDVSQYFQTRDFVEVYLEDEGEEAIAASDASKELLNRTLNQRHLYHYSKYVRARGIASLCGRVYLKGWWEQSVRQDVIDWVTHYSLPSNDIYGNPLLSEDQEFEYEEYQEPVMGEVPVIDRFNYDIWDQRNVFTSNEYAYSLQQKQWVTFRSEEKLGELESKKESEGYFNLDKIKTWTPADKTETAKESYDKDDNFNPVTSAIQRPFDVYERYGSFWTTFDTDEDGEPVPGTEKIGLDKDGNPLKKAKLVEVIITVAANSDRRCLIGFKLNPYKDANGVTYRPILRGLCYIHPTNDGGVGDGKYAKELQIAIDDTFNVSQDRVMLATMPTIKTSKHNIEDNSSLYWEPGHFMEFDKDPNEIQEFKITDDITGALEQITMLGQKMQQADAIQPPSMGQMGQASATATAFAGASYATGERTNYKSLTFENTALCELYWMIQQMTFQFAFPETGKKLMGDKVYDFDPSRDFYYKPISQSIEPEYSKIAKRKEWTALFGYAAQLAPIHPDGIKMLNYIFGKIAELMGDEYVTIAQGQLDENTPVQQEGGVSAVPGSAAGPASNQNAAPMSGMEMGTRGIANIGAY